MKIKYTKWLLNNTSNLRGKTVAITGSTGGIGVELSRYLAYLGASLILVDRNRQRSEAHKRRLESEFPDISVKCITADLEDIASVKDAAEELISAGIDIFIHNAGAYSIPRHKTSLGYDNVFQINFVSPYYIIRGLLPTLRARGGRAVVVGSIAHNYSKTNALDIDFSNNKKASKVYGNAKRYLMYSLAELFRNEREASLAITHPGITFTNITAHYPKVIFAIIKYPMKVIFMPAKKAALSILKGVFTKTDGAEWIGPRIFDVWGMPKKKKLKTAGESERIYIAKTAEDIYSKIKSEGY